MQVQNVIPIFRIFDYAKAIEFYVGWMGLAIDWEHRFEPTLPVYMQVSGNGLILNLSEHHGDGTPGTRVHVKCTGVKAYHQVLLDKKYNYGRPGLEKTFYNTWTLIVHDPFGNQLIFEEDIKPETDAYTLSPEY